MEIPFFKYEGIGNDFIVVSAEDLLGIELEPELVRRICDRHLGIGADGILVAGKTQQSFSMKVHNADGSMAEMCGNGIRCVVKFLIDQGMLKDQIVKIETAGGVKECHVIDAGKQVRVDMGRPSLEPQKVPIQSGQSWIEHSVDIDDVRRGVTAISMGNPHAVVFDVPEADREEFARALAAHSEFTQGVNVGIAKILDREEMQLRVFERGAGWTQACGTGACAAVVAAVETGRIPYSERVRVNLPGGALSISYVEKGGTVWMTGPARFVFAGELNPANFR